VRARLVDALNRYESAVYRWVAVNSARRGARKQQVTDHRNPTMPSGKMRNRPTPTKAPAPAPTAEANKGVYQAEPDIERIFLRYGNRFGDGGKESWNCQVELIEAHHRAGRMSLQDRRRALYTVEHLFEKLGGADVVWRGVGG